MKKTCFNCKHFHDCLAEANSSQYHIHDYCEIFRTILPFDMNTEVNKFLDKHWATMYKASTGCGYEVYDDKETGEANCYQHKDADKEFWPDERFEFNKKHNIELAIKTLEYMFEKDEVCDEFDEDTWHKLADYYNKDEISYYRYLSKILRRLNNGN